MSNTCCDKRVPRSGRMIIQEYYKGDGMKTDFSTIPFDTWSAMQERRQALVESDFDWSSVRDKMEGTPQVGGAVRVNWIYDIPDSHGRIVQLPYADTTGKNRLVPSWAGMIVYTNLDDGKAGSMEFWQFLGQLLAMENVEKVKCLEQTP